MGWKVIAGCARGTDHVKSGIPCQDAHYHQVVDDWLFAAVSDGAGTATKSDQGSWLLVKGVIDALASALKAGESSSSDLDEAFWKQQITAAIETVRKNLVDAAGNLEEYHATLVGFLSGPDCRLFFHIGDGCGVAVAGKDWSGVTVSLPDNGEFANQTWFFTLDDWQQHLRFTPVDKSASTFVLMSDGAMSFGMAPQLKGLDPRFIQPVDSYLESAEEKAGADALSATLDSPKTYSITSDDKTLLWARLQ